MTIHQAVRALRTELGDSQQAFATRLGLSIRAIVNYESNRVPSMKVMGQLMRVALEHRKLDLAKPFYDQLRAATAMETATPGKLEGIASQFHIAITLLKKMCKKRGIDPTSEDVQQLESVLTQGMSDVLALSPFADPKHLSGDRP